MPAPKSVWPPLLRSARIGALAGAALGAALAVPLRAPGEPLDDALGMVAVWTLAGGGIGSFFFLREVLVPGGDPQRYGLSRLRAFGLLVLVWMAMGPAILLVSTLVSVPLG